MTEENSKPPSKEGDKPKPNRNRNRNRNRNKNREGKEGENLVQANRNNRNKSKGNSEAYKKRRTNNTPSPKGFEGILFKYNNLLSQYLLARKKYHDLFFRADPQQREKLERVFYHTIEQLRAFEEGLSEEDKIKFTATVNGLKPDRAYSLNHALDPAHLIIKDEGPVQDPHLLPSQEASSFEQDDEESKGSIDDYKSYKGL